MNPCLVNGTRLASRKIEKNKRKRNRSLTILPTQPLITYVKNYIVLYHLCRNSLYIHAKMAATDAVELCIQEAKIDRWSCKKWTLDIVFFKVNIKHNFLVNRFFKIKLRHNFLVNCFFQRNLSKLHSARSLSYMLSKKGHYMKKWSFGKRKI
jgi:hypothetical protein